MTKIICGICEGLIKEVNDGKDETILGYDGCEEPYEEKDYGGYYE